LARQQWRRAEEAELDTERTAIRLSDAGNLADNGVERAAGCGINGHVSCLAPMEKAQQACWNQSVDAQSRE
jgi:hypothetical protein